MLWDIPSGKWTRLEVAGPLVVKAHKERVAAKETAIDLGGRIRLAWYRDPLGVGTTEELTVLGERCARLKKLPQMDKFTADVEAVAGFISTKKTLEGLKAARALQRKLEEFAEAQYPATRASSGAAGTVSARPAAWRTTRRPPGGPSRALTPTSPTGVQATADSIPRS